MSDRSLTDTQKNSGGGARPRALIRGARAALATALVAGLVLTGATAANADGVGGGGVGGGGGGGQIASQYWLYSGDNLDATTGEPFQGWGQQSIDTFADAMEQQGGWANGVGGNRSGLQAACTQALDQANSRSSSANPKSRVVQVGVSVDYQNGGWWMGWGGDQATMRQWYQEQTDTNYWQPNFPGHSASLLSLVHDAFQAAVTPTPRIVCVALNMEEVVNYDLSISTDKAATFSQAGTTNAVRDTIHASASNAIRENVTAKVELNWGGVEGNGKAVTKNVSIANNGDTSSPSFSPSDFGWSSWPSGKFWFDVTVDKQGQMNSAVSHGGSGDSRENWTASRIAPAKTITSGPADDELADNEVLTSGMSYNAKITAAPNGWASSMTISDTTSTDKVYIGDDASDVASNAYVLDPSGNKVSGASIKIDRGTSGKVTVSGTVTNIPAGNQSRLYTLVVPTYLQPTKSDYTITDSSKVCYTSGQTDCISGNSKTTRKVTPAPNKVWVLDQNGALSAADPSKTNQAGVDNKVFAPGSDIGAVVNGSIPAKLAENLSSYTLTDDWSGAKTYVDFSDASKARVFQDGVDVTRNFTITVKNSVTTATAKPAFLSTTKGLAKDSSMKLYVAGQFRTDYTSIKPTSLTNSGSEQYNNESIDTNSPAVFTVTPNPDKAWVLDKDGGLSTVDSSKSNAVGADGKIFLAGDAVSAVINGKIPANLGAALKSYTISDDWSDASKYVDFSDVSQAKVYYNGADVTKAFTVNIANHKTTATAKPAFLAGTAGLAKDASVKLIISGAFRTDFDTNGKVVSLTNSGSEAWNGKEVATNSPPVFTWTPDPNKQVLGSSEESGDKTYADINGAAVWPGQKLEYSVGVDLRVPTGTARGVKSLAVQDVYDPYFTPQKSSVEFWDSRDASNPKPVAKSNYSLTFDEAEHSFTATFKQSWIDAQVQNSGANSNWLTQGWLTMRFAGAVSKSVAAGSTVSNVAYQIINGAKTASDVPTVKIPTVTPDKDALASSGADIDGKTVVTGDKIVYRLTLDGGPARKDLAYNVHKLGIVDDYDDEYVSVDPTAITVTNKATGEDVTGKFNVQVKDGIAYVFAKTVDTEGAYGGTIPGDPQPDDLKAFDEKAISPLEDPIIDQSLLGQQYFVTLPAVVTKADAGHVITNTARQNIQNTMFVTKTVSNPVAPIDPSKDLVIDPSTKDESKDGTEVRMNTVFNYRLNSSTIPGNRAYAASQWSVSDSFDAVHDQYTGTWAVYANTDLFDGDTKLFGKGDLIQQSPAADAVEDGEPSAGYFDVSFDHPSATFTATATEKYLDLVEADGDHENGWSIYTKMVRVAPGKGIVNTAKESYNDFERASNEVSTFTIEYPAIAVQKFTTSEGATKGVHASADAAYTMTAEQLATSKDVAGQQNGVPVDITFQNTGDVPLEDVQIADVTQTDMHGELQSLMCLAPQDPTAPALIQGDTKLAADSDGMIWVTPATISELSLNGAVDCRATLRDMEPGMLHASTVVVSGKSIFSDTTVKADATWFARAVSAPSVTIREYTLDEGAAKGDRNLPTQALDLSPTEGKSGVRVAVAVKNNGNEDLSGVAVTTATTGKTTGKIGDLHLLVAAPDGAKDTLTVDGKRYVEKPAAELEGLKTGEQALLVGTLTGVKEGTSHASVASVTGAGAYSGTKVTASDPWNAKLAAPVVEPPKPPVKAGAVTGTPVTAHQDRSSLLGSAALLLLAAVIAAWVVRRRMRWDRG